MDDYKAEECSETQHRFNLTSKNRQEAANLDQSGHSIEHDEVPAAAHIGIARLEQLLVEPSEAPFLIGMGTLPCGGRSSAPYRHAANLDQSGHSIDEIDEVCAPAIESARLLVEPTGESPLNGTDTSSSRDEGSPATYRKITDFDQSGRSIETDTVCAPFVESAGLLDEPSETGTLSRGERSSVAYRQAVDLDQSGHSIEADEVCAPFVESARLLSVEPSEHPPDITDTVLIDEGSSAIYSPAARDRDQSGHSIEHGKIGVPFVKSARLLLEPSEHSLDVTDTLLRDGGSSATYRQARDLDHSGHSIEQDEICAPFVESARLSSSTAYRQAVYLDQLGQRIEQDEVYATNIERATRSEQRGSDGRFGLADRAKNDQSSHGLNGNYHINNISSSGMDNPMVGDDDKNACTPMEMRCAPSSSWRQNDLKWNLSGQQGWGKGVIRTKNLLDLKASSIPFPSESVDDGGLLPLASSELSPSRLQATPNLRRNPSETRRSAGVGVIRAKTLQDLEASCTSLPSGSMGDDDPRLLARSKSSPSRPTPDLQRNSTTLASESVDDGEPCPLARSELSPLPLRATSDLQRNSSETRRSTGVGVIRAKTLQDLEASCTSLRSFRSGSENCSSRLPVTGRALDPELNLENQNLKWQRITGTNPDACAVGTSGSESLTHSIVSPKADDSAHRARAGKVQSLCNLEASVISKLSEKRPFGDCDRLIPVVCALDTSKRKNNAESFLSAEKSAKKTLHSGHPGSAGHVQSLCSLEASVLSKDSRAYVVDPVSRSRSTFQALNSVELDNSLPSDKIRNMQSLCKMEESVIRKQSKDGSLAVVSSNAVDIRELEPDPETHSSPRQPVIDKAEQGLTPGGSRPGAYEARYTLQPSWATGNRHDLDSTMTLPFDSAGVEEADQHAEGSNLFALNTTDYDLEQEGKAKKKRRRNLMILFLTAAIIGALAIGVVIVLTRSGRSSNHGSSSSNQACEVVKSIQQQCRCNGRMVEFPDDTLQRFDVLVEALVGTVYSSYDEDIYSCNSRNMALAQVASEMGFDIKTQIQRFLLIFVYFSWRGDSWQQTDGWLSAATECSWYGVSCTNREVTGLEFSNNNINGELVRELFFLKSLERFVVEGDTDKLSGSFPSEIGLLRNLTIFSADVLAIRGTLPTEVGELTLLEKLVLFSKTDIISGNIPSEIGRLTRLETLLIVETFIQGPIPFEIFKLTDLRVFNMSHNRLFGEFPQDSQSLSLLTTLDLFDNQLTGKVPNISHFPYLMHYRVGNNKYRSGQSLDTIWDNTNLVTIDLKSTYMSGTIPEDALGRISNLEFLDLWRTRVAGTIPTTIGRLGMLEYFRLAQSEISGPIPSELGLCSSLSALHFETTELTGTVPSELLNIPNLNELYLYESERLFGTLPSEYCSTLEELRLTCESIRCPCEEPSICDCANR